MSLTENDLDTIRERAEAAMPGPWYFGDRWHIQGASHCQCLESFGPLIREARMDINGSMMHAHVHEAEEPYWRHGINAAPSEETGWHVGSIVNDTDEYGYMDDADARFIAAARTDVPALLAEVKRMRAGIEHLEITAQYGQHLAAESRNRDMEYAYRQVEQTCHGLLNPTGGEANE